jgi:hypothetical protein
MNIRRKERIERKKGRKGKNRRGEGETEERRIRRCRGIVEEE